MQLSLSLKGFIGLSLFLLCACSKERMQPEKTIYFENDVLPIFQSNCSQAGCHSASDKEKSDDFSSYASIMASGKGEGIVAGDYKNSAIYSAITTAGLDLMPQKPYSPLSDDQIATIALWIKQGALNNSTTVQVDLTRVSYNQSVRPILNTYCTGCHTTGNASGGISFSSYDTSIVPVVNGKLLGCIKQLSGYKAMPKSGNKLSDANTAIIEAWINKGYLND